MKVSMLELSPVSAGRGEAQALRDSEAQPMRDVLTELEDVLLELRSVAGLHVVTFVLQHAVSCEDTPESDKPGAVMKALFPRLDQRRCLHVVATTSRGT